MYKRQAPASPAAADDRPRAPSRRGTDAAGGGGGGGGPGSAPASPRRSPARPGPSPRRAPAAAPGPHAGVVRCVQTLAAALGSQPWVREIKAIETASIPVIKLLADPAVLGCPLPEFRRTRPRARSEDAARALAETDAPDLPPPPPPPQRPRAAPTAAAATPPSSTPAPPTWCGAVGRCDAGLLAVDISFEAPNHGGLASSRYALEAMGRWPELAPLLLVLKELLCQRGLNEPFTGGLSSYSLLLLAMTALLQAGVDPLEAPLPRPQHHTPLGEAAPGAEPPAAQRAPLGPPTSVREAWARLRDDPARRRRPLRDAAGAGARRRPSLAARIRGGDALLWSGTDQRRAFERDDDALGYLLTFFLEFFGRHFDPQRHAVSVLRGDAGIIAMAGPGYTTDPQFVAPLIEDPLECTRNVSRSCFGIAQIQNVFAHCLCILESKGAAAAMSDDSCNILSLVLSY